MAAHHFVISYDANEALPFGFAWVVNLGGDHRGGGGFTYYATRAECIARSKTHKFYTNPVCIDDESVVSA
jgi:hypothetical protein